MVRSLATLDLIVMASGRSGAAPSIFTMISSVYLCLQKRLHGSSGVGYELLLFGVFCVSFHVWHMAFIQSQL